MNYRILLLTLIVTLVAAGCTAVGEVETAVEATADTAKQADTQPATLAEQEAPAVAEKDAGEPDVQTAEPTATQPPAPTEAPVLPVIGPAPNWDNEVWINSDGPLPLEDLRGKVVLLEFWTFG